MAAPTFVIQTGSVALSASTTKSLIIVNPAVVGFRLTELGISFDASTAVTAVRMDLYRVVTIGSAAGSTATVVKANTPLDVAAQSTGLVTITTEPTTVEILRSWFVQPAGGLFAIQFPLGREPAAAGTGQRIGLRYTTPASVTPNSVTYLEWEE